MEVEEALLRAFIVPERRNHYVARLANRKTRKKLLASFYHLHDLDERYATRIDPRAQRADTIDALLRKRGAPDRCYIMSASSDLDGEYVALGEALREIVGWCDGAFISCIPGRLGYFEGEEP